jgi:hypothetical protein
MMSGGGKDDGGWRAGVDVKLKLEMKGACAMEHLPLPCVEILAASRRGCHAKRLGREIHGILLCQHSAAWTSSTLPQFSALLAASTDGTQERNWIFSNSTSRQQPAKKYQSEACCLFEETGNLFLTEPPK